MKLSALSLEELDHQAETDARLLRQLSGHCGLLSKFIETQKSLWERGPERALSPDERRLSMQIFDRLLDYQLLLDGMSQFHQDFWYLDVFSDPTRHARHFLLGFHSYCHQLALGLRFIEKTINKPQFEVLFDEGSEDVGVFQGAYSRLKWNVVHVENIAKVFAAHQYHKLMSYTCYRKFGEDPLLPFILEDVERAYQEAKERLSQDGTKLFSGNALDMLRDGLYSAWFPIQTEIARFFGHTKVKRIGAGLISEAQIKEATALSQPGDIIVERRNWYLSNIGLPGFWPHAALWLGSPEEFCAFFDRDEEVTYFYQKPFSQILKEKYPAAWKSYTTPDDNNDARRIIEAIGEGVVFTSAEHSLCCDYAAAMRPKISKVEIARAIEHAFHYAGRQYDFDFDIHSDRSIFCSELIYKSYEPRHSYGGVRFGLIDLLGRTTLPPNQIITQFDEEFESENRQLDFVWFLDGREKDEAAFFNDVESLRASHKRTKWDISQE
jgi:hypothetical protein